MPARRDPSDFMKAMQTTKLELEWKNFGLQMMVDMNLMLEPEFMVRQDGYDFIRDQITVAMRTKILTDNLPPETVSASKGVLFHEPASTWQMWKRNNQGHWYTWKWLDAWLKKWPIQYVQTERVATLEVNLERFRSYPEAQYRASDFRLGKAVLMHNMSNPWWDLSGPDRIE